MNKEQKINLAVGIEQPSEEGDLEEFEVTDKEPSEPPAENPRKYHIGDHSYPRGAIRVPDIKPKPGEEFEPPVDGGEEYLTPAEVERRDLKELKEARQRKKDLV